MNADGDARRFRLLNELHEVARKKGGWTSHAFHDYIVDRIDYYWRSIDQLAETNRMLEIRLNSRTKEKPPLQ